MFGSGLLTLSRFPISEAVFHQYSAAGDPAALTCGDYYAAKGKGGRGQLGLGMRG